VAGIIAVSSLYRSCRALQALIKHQLGDSLFLPAEAIDGEHSCRLLAQPAFRSKLAMLAEHGGYPWDASQAGTSAIGLPRWSSPQHWGRAGRRPGSVSAGR
jgi:hypothetical protein